MAEDGVPQEENPLTALKHELREVLDEAFGYMWPLIEQKVKQSYKNGIAEGERRAKSGDAPRASDAPNKRQWRRGKE